MTGRERVQQLKEAGFADAVTAAILDVDVDTVVSMQQGELETIPAPGEVDLGALNSRLSALEAADETSDDADAATATALTALDSRLDTLEGNTLDARLDTLEGHNIDARLDAIEAVPVPKIVRGTVLDDGTKVRGTGFTCARLGAGTYEITFSPAFAARPIIVATPQTHANFNTLIRVDDTATSASKVTFQVYNTAGSARDVTFEFVAVAV